MAYYNHRGPPSGTDVNDDRTMPGMRIPETIQESIDAGWGQDNEPQMYPDRGHQPDLLTDIREERPEDTERRRARQRYTYIPSTSSFSPNQRPPIPTQPIPSVYLSSPVIPPIIPGSYQTPRPADDYPYGYPIPQPGIFPPYGYPIPQPGILPPLPPEIPLNYRRSRASLSSTTGTEVDASPVMYASVDPFRLQGKYKAPKPSLPVAHDYPHDGGPPDEGPDYVIYPYAHRRTVLVALLVDFLNMSFGFLFSSLPRQVYLLFLLYLPSFYFSRVARIFDEAEMSMPEIENMALQAMGSITLQELQWSSPASANLKGTWESFIESLLREWKTLNIISVLLLSLVPSPAFELILRLTKPPSAILTILQIEAAGTDPIARNCALISLICALMSLLYGCMYIIRFSSMRKTYKALEWAQVSLQPTLTSQSILILSPRAELAIRIAISAILGLGVLHFALILNTLRQYGDSMDRNFKKELELVVKQKRQARGYGHGHGYSGPHSYGNYFGANAAGVYPMPHQPTPRWFRPAKVIDFRFQLLLSRPMPDHLTDRDFTQEKWDKFINVCFLNCVRYFCLNFFKMQEAYSAWNGVIASGPFSVNGSALNPPRPQDAVAQLLEKWNQKYFQRHSTLGILCHEYIDLFPDSPVFAIYLVDATPVDGQPIIIAERFGPVPEGLSRIDIFDQPGRDKKSTRRILGRTSIFSTRNPLDGRVRFPDQSEDIRSPAGPYTPAYPDDQAARTASSSPSPRPSPPGVTPQSSFIDESGRFRTPTGERRHRSRSPSTRSESLSRSTPFIPPLPSGYFHPGVVAPAPPIPPPLRRRPTRHTSEALDRAPQLYRNGGWNYLSPGYSWGPPPAPPASGPGPEPLDRRAQNSTRRSARRRRSRTLSPARRESESENRYLPLPAVSPDYPWPARPDLAPLTPNTIRTVTPSAISNLDLLVPPHTPWTPYQYAQLMPPPQFGDPRTNLAEMLSDNYPRQGQSMASSTVYLRERPSQRRLRRQASRFQEPPGAPDILGLRPVTEPVAPPVSELSSPMVQDHNDILRRRRSSSTSYRSFSRSPPRPQEDLPPAEPGDLPDPPVDTVQHDHQSLPPVVTRDRGSQFTGGASSSMASHRGRDPTPTGRAAEDPRVLTGMDSSGSHRRSAVYSGPAPSQAAPPQVDATNQNPVRGPWTMDHFSLKTIFDNP
ncbi:hypothetical protein DXG01_013532 [Tephrocybe rancida]|nr:hypothetical protein DXG01_013532 [Tephrocybe rancida]